VLSFADIFGFRAACALFNFKDDLLTFSQAFISVHRNRRKMDKYITAVLFINEAITFFVIEPFYSAISQNVILLS